MKLFGITLGTTHQSLTKAFDRGLEITLDTTYRSLMGVFRWCYVKDWAVMEEIGLRAFIVANRVNRVRAKEFASLDVSDEIVKAVMANNASTWDVAQFELFGKMTKEALKGIAKDAPVKRPPIADSCRPVIVITPESVGAIKKRRLELAEARNKRLERQGRRAKEIKEQLVIEEEMEKRRKEELASQSLAD